MATDSRFQQRSIASISFSFLIHISLIIGLVVAADSGIGLSGSSSNGSIAGTGNQEEIEIQFDEITASPQTESRVTTKPRRSPVQKQAKPAPLTSDDSDIAIREALQAAREEGADVQDQLPATDEPESLSPEIADFPDVLPASEDQGPVAGTEATTNTVTEQVTETKADTVAGTGTNPGNKGTGTGTGAGNGNHLVIVNASQRHPLPGNPLPKYPERDRYLRNQGTAVLIGRVGADGRITNVQIEKSSGSKTMDQEAVTAFRKWRFEPGPEVLVRKSFAFKLSGKEKVVPARLGRRSFVSE